MATAQKTLLQLKEEGEKKEEEEEFDEELPPMDSIKLISADGFEFYVDKATALISITIRNMLYGHANFEEAETKVFRFPNIRAEILERIIEYWHYRTQYSNHLDQLPKFNIDPKIAIDLLNAAEYLQT